MLFCVHSRTKLSIGSSEWPDETGGSTVRGSKKLKNVFTVTKSWWETCADNDTECFNHHQVRDQCWTMSKNRGNYWGLSSKPQLKHWKNACIGNLVWEIRSMHTFIPHFSHSKLETSLRCCIYAIVRHSWKFKLRGLLQRTNAVMSVSIIPACDPFLL